VTPRAEDAERRLIRRTARRIVIQTGALFALCIAVLGVLAAGLIVRAQNADAQRTLQAAVDDADAVTDPPSAVVVYRVDAGKARASARLHGRPLDQRALAEVVRGRPVVVSRAHRDGRAYQLRTVRRGDVLIQAGYDLTDQRAERKRLVEGLAAAGLAGLVVACGIGAVTARRAVRPLEDAFDRQRRFVADASHELRTPVAQAHTRAQLLARALAAESGTDDRSGLAVEAGLLVRSTGVLGEIIHDLLLSAQVEAGAAETVPVDLAELVTVSVDAERIRAEETGVALTTAAPDGPYLVEGSPVALRRVLASLIDNAMGHVKSGGSVTVTVERREAGRRRREKATASSVIVCTVADDGAGFDPSEAEAIFERFARGDHGDSRRLGLGLALARDVVRAHHGTIAASGAPGRGARFTVTLPAA